MKESKNLDKQHSVSPLSLKSTRLHAYNALVRVITLATLLTKSSILIKIYVISNSKCNYEKT